VSTRELARRTLNQSGLWVDLRRLQREGFLRAWRRTRLWSRILETPPLTTAVLGPGAPVEVHLLCCRRDYLSAIWAIKSFYHGSRASYPLVVHLQGYDTTRALARLQAHFPTARIIPQTQADAAVEPWLEERGLARLLKARRDSPIMLKLVDFAILSESVNVLTLDSDVVFFAPAPELLVGSDRPLEHTFFQRDPASNYNLLGERARAALGFEPAPCVNTGIIVESRESLDLALCERYLENPEVARPTGLIEQTLHALLASEQGRVAYLPPSYLLSLEPGLPNGLVARHYAGPTRPLLTDEGMPELIRRGFLEDLRLGAIEARL
jgi:hypothetical protein